MKLVTFRLPDQTTRAGVVRDERVIALDYPTVLDLLRDSDGLEKARHALERARKENTHEEVTRAVPHSQQPLLGIMPQVRHHTLSDEYMLHELVLLTPIPDPPSVRDFYAFEQHVKA